MSNGDYLRGLLRRKAAMFRATVLADAGRGDYTVRLDDTRGTVTATPIMAGANLVPGQKVLVSRTDSMGRGMGGGYSIHGSAPSTVKGSSGADELSEEDERTGATVTLIEPQPVTLEAGGSPVTINIYGTGLSDEVATYGHAGITNDSAPVPTDTQITLSVDATGVTPLGQYSLTVAGHTIENFFTVIELPSQLGGGVWHQDTLNTSEAGGTWGMVRRSIFRTGDTALGPYDDWADDFSAWGGIVYCSDEEKILALVGPMDLDLDEPVDVGLEISDQLVVSSFALPFDGYWGSTAIYKFGKVYYIKDGRGSLISMDPDGTNGADHAVTGHLSGLHVLFNDPYEDDVIWIGGWNVSTNGRPYLLRLTFSTPTAFTVEKVELSTSNATVSGAFGVTSDYVYGCVVNDDRKVVRVAKSGMTATEHTFTGSGTWNVQGCTTKDGYVYVIAFNGSNSMTIFKVSETTMLSTNSAQLGTTFKSVRTMLVRNSEIIASGQHGTYAVLSDDLSVNTYTAGGHQLVVL
jgi:hypothetical protein